MMREPLKNRAQGRWREILANVGISHKHLVNRHGPCPICGGKDRFRFDDKDGRGTFYCNHCGAGDGITLVMLFRSCDFAEAARLVEETIGTATAPLTVRSTPAAEDVAAKHREAKNIWRSSARIVTGDPVDLYLRRRCGKTPETRALRVLAPTGRQKLFALVSAFVDVHGDLCAVQRTFLTPDGRKADIEPVRLYTGKLPDGGAVRLAQHGKTLGIAEGIETALSAAIMFNIPTWAALDAHHLRTWEPPEGVTEVVAFADNDMSSTGQLAAFALTERLARGRGLTAVVEMPPVRGTDWNDVLQQRLAERAAAREEAIHG